MPINSADDLRIGAGGATSAWMNGVKVWPSITSGQMLVVFSLDTPVGVTGAPSAGVASGVALPIALLTNDVPTGTVQNATSVDLPAGFQVDGASTTMHVNDLAVPGLYARIWVDSTDAYQPSDVGGIGYDDAEAFLTGPFTGGPNVYAEAYNDTGSSFVVANGFIVVDWTG